jgi:uncharacterized membrane protein (DUF485 family)
MDRRRHGIDALCGGSSVRRSTIGPRSRHFDGADPETKRLSGFAKGGICAALRGRTATRLFSRRKSDFDKNFTVMGGTKMDGAALARIQRDPNYIRLVRERKSFGWTLSIIILVLYYGFIALVAFAPDVIATKVAGSITIGLILGVALILASIVLTGIYVLRANSQYDDLTKAIVDANALGGK